MPSMHRWLSDKMSLMITAIGQVQFVAQSDNYSTCFEDVTFPV